MPVDPNTITVQKLLEGTGEFLYAVRRDGMLEVVEIRGQLEVFWVIGSFLFFARFSSILSVVTEHTASSASCADLGYSPSKLSGYHPITPQKDQGVPIDVAKLRPVRPWRQGHSFPGHLQLREVPSFERGACASQAPDKGPQNCSSFDRDVSFKRRIGKVSINLCFSTGSNDKPSLLSQTIFSKSTGVATAVNFFGQ